MVQTMSQMPNQERKVKSSLLFGYMPLHLRLRESVLVIRRLCPLLRVFEATRNLKTTVMKNEKNDRQNHRAPAIVMKIRVRPPRHFRPSKREQKIEEVSSRRVEDLRMSCCREDGSFVATDAGRGSPNFERPQGRERDAVPRRRSSITGILAVQKLTEVTSAIRLADVLRRGCCN